MKNKKQLQSIYLTTLKTWIKDKNINHPLENETKRVITSLGSKKSFLVLQQPPDAVLK